MTLIGRGRNTKKLLLPWRSGVGCRLAGQKQGLSEEEKSPVSQHFRLCLLHENGVLVLAPLEDSSVHCPVQSVILEFLNGYQPATTVNPRGHHRGIRISPGGFCLSGWPFASKQSLHAFSLNAKNALLLGIYEAGVWKLVFKFVWPGVGVRGGGRKGVLLEDSSPGESSRNAPNLESLTLI